MLSDADRRMLAEIEYSLRAEDPRFVRRFNSRRRSQRQGVAVWLAFIAATTIIVVSLLAGSALGIVSGLVAAGVTVGAWASHRTDHRRPG